MPLTAVVLPTKENFTPSEAGAVALMVREYASYSAARAETVVLGHPVETPFTDVRFMPVVPRGRWFRRDTVAYAAGCAHVLRSLKPETVEVHNRIEVFRYLRKALPDAAVALCLHNDPLTMRGARRPDERRAIIAEANAVFCVSDFLRRRFLTDLPDQAASKVHILPNAMDPTRYGVSSGPREKLILFVGRLVADKGALLFAQTMADLLPALPEWRALMIGSDRPGQTTPTTAHNGIVIAALREAGERAKWQGFISHDAVMAVFAKTEIAVVPSLWDEPFGRTALEAMMAGCAVVTTGRGGLAEIVGDAALTVAGDRESLRAALQRLATDPALRAHLQVAGRERAALLFDIRMHAARLDRMRRSGYGACQ